MHSSYEGGTLCSLIPINASACLRRSLWLW